jgi:hypothetical protein
MRLEIGIRSDLACNGPQCHRLNSTPLLRYFFSLLLHELSQLRPLVAVKGGHWSGMRILAAMRMSFPGLQGWESGYEALRATLMAGAGHSPEAAEKQGQRLVEETGCPYADSVLLPALRETGRFVDQEQVTL